MTRTRLRDRIADLAWDAALQRQTFSSHDIAADLKISLSWAETIVAAWLREGSAHEAGEAAGRRIYRVDQDFVRLPGRTAEDNMWTAMRKLRSFSPTTIAAHATAGAIEVTPDTAATYCRALLAAGFLAVSRRAAPAMKREAVYALVTETGPKAPVPARVRAIRDPNTGRIIVLEDRA